MKKYFFSFWLLFVAGLITTVYSCKEDEKGEPKQGKKDSTETVDVLTDAGVVINGVKWATRNVDAPGKFAVKAEDAGMFYQWNSKTAWSATDDITNWNIVVTTGRIWKEENDPSPAGWRVPTLDDIKKLLDENKVTIEWTAVNEINGTRFTDQVTGNSIFLPAVGFRNYETGILYNVGSYGRYWGNSAYTRDDDDAGAYYMAIHSSEPDWGCGYRLYGRSIRCVKNE